MASISFNNQSGVNPTSPFLPYNGGGVFLDSPLRFDTGSGGRLASWYSGVQKGILIENSGTLTTIGDSTINLKVGSANAGTAMTVNGSVTSGTVGLLSGQYLNVSINGSSYKLALFNP